MLPCKPVAAVTTLKGRAFIDAAKNFVENHYEGSKVIYGDTDSIMIFWGKGTEVKDAALKGKEAALVAGLSYLKKAEYKKGLDYLDKFSANDALLGPSIIAAKAACKSGLGELEKAASLYEKAARLGDNEYTSIYFQKAGVHYELSKNYSAALACYEELDNKYGTTREGQDAEKYIYRLKGLMGELNK